jgi:DNA polymerase I-like protein with 3'-5' exonuclease and polymerase domains
MIAAVDFESYYDKDLSVTEMGAWKYARATDIYLVSIYTNTGLIWVGHPKDAPWDQIAGADWLMHNAAFDLTLLRWLQESGIIPPVEPRRVFDTADMAAYCAAPRSLKESSKFFLGHQIKKTTRDNMKGKQWNDMTREFQIEVARYALVDAKTTLELFQKLRPHFPLREQEISRMTRDMGMRGVPVNAEKLKAARETLQAECERTKNLLPWKDSGKALLSLSAIREQCAIEGIRAPSSFAEKSPEGAAWEDRYSTVYPWVSAVRAYRKANKHLQTVETMLTRVKPDGWMPYELKYFGATTGRDSGGGGWNAQNQPRGEIAGVELRSMIEAPEGKTLIIADLSQIEARVLLYLARDKAALDIIASGVDVYEAHARATMGYTDPRLLADVDAHLRQVAKARVLGLGFQCGPGRFIEVAKVMANLVISAEESERIVQDYRQKNPKVVNLWRRLDSDLRRAAGEPDKLLLLELPSGRSLIYRAVSVKNGEVVCLLPKNGKMAECKIYGGLLTENITQATARDILMHHATELESLGHQIIMRVHDELVFVADEDKAERQAAEIRAIMSTPPDWCRTLPLAADVKISKFYKK